MVIKDQKVRKKAQKYAKIRRIVFVFYVFSPIVLYLFFRYLRSSGGARYNGLDVVGLEVALEI